MAASRCWRAARVISTTSPGRCSTRCTGCRTRPSPAVTGAWMMSWINRRELFAAAGGVVAAWLTRRRAAGGASRVLIDPTLLSNATSHLSLDWWRASPDGSHVVYGVSKDGSEDSILHVIAVADGRQLPERIANTEDANPQWLADGSGFFYNQLTGAVDTPERYLDSQARFHKLGADPESDPILMKRGLDPRVQYERIQMPYVVVHEGSRHALLLLADVREE